MSRYRHEYKYMIDARQEGILMLKARSLMQPDAHAGADGRYMVRSLYLDDPEDSAVRKRLLTEINIRGMMPKTIVTYERVPLVYSGGNVRITFDRRITSSEDLRHFLTADYTERPVLPPGQSILEVKWDELMPGFIRENLKMEDLHWLAFSKYFLCRTIHN